MKIAIPCENGEVMQHFGHATEFTVYTIEDIKPIEKETVTFDDTDHEKVAGGLKSRGIDLVICGNIGEGAHAAIDNAHMLLISGVTGNADEAVDSFLQGNLELMTGDSSASAGGCGAGVVAFLNGRLLSGSDALLDLMNFSALAADADLIVTGEGMVDDQTAGGKLVSAVAARANGTPVVVLAGGIAEGTNLEALYEKGVTAVMPVTSRPMTLGEAMSSGAEGVRLTATQLFRLAGALKA